MLGSIDKFSLLLILYVMITDPSIDDSSTLEQSNSDTPSSTETATTTADQPTSLFLPPTTTDSTKSISVDQSSTNSTPKNVQSSERTSKQQPTSVLSASDETQSKTSLPVADPIQIDDQPTTVETASGKPNTELPNTEQYSSTKSNSILPPPTESPFLELQSTGDPTTIQVNKIEQQQETDQMPIVEIQINKQQSNEQQTSESQQTTEQPTTEPETNESDSTKLSMDIPNTKTEIIDPTMKITMKLSPPITLNTAENGATSTRFIQSIPLMIICILIVGVF